MTSYNLAQIAEFTSGNLSGNSNLIITDLAYDSRHLVKPRSSIFFALKSQKNDGHKYISEAFNKGVRAFVVENGFSSDLDASFISVEDTFSALQSLGKSHRKAFKNPIIGITGSNGKTIVKEWLDQILSVEFKTSASPRSYNSQLGVPLSLWTLNPNHDFGIIEAGISEPNEMEKLADIIQPTIGVFTHLGDAHLHNFESVDQLISEKLKLFKSCEQVVVNEDEKQVIQALKATGISLFIWGNKEAVDLKFDIKSDGTTAKIQVLYKNQNFELNTPLTDKASLENLGHVVSASLELGVSVETLIAEIPRLTPLDMRVQVMKGVNKCMIINDSYTADISALENALDLSNKFSFEKSKTLIISDSSHSDSNQDQLEKLISEKGIERLITIGKNSEKLLPSKPNREHYETVEKLLEANLSFKEEVIVIKGARSFQLEKIAQRLQLQDHQTVLEINLNAFTENLEFYRAKLAPETKVMAMVKAFSYGAGSFEVASHLQNLGVDYLAVAYADEGVELRKNGIQLPILVLNPESAAFDSIIRYQLEPEIYSLQILGEFLAFLALQRQTKFPIHIKLDTGMHRLGMDSSEIETLNSALKTELVEVKSIFSHLAASDSQSHDGFSIKQIDIFDEMSKEIRHQLSENPLRHICNSSAISRFPQAHFDMVRLGIGLYGISSEDEENTSLKLAGKLKTTIIQTRTLSPGESIGYNRSYVANKETKVGIIPIGYADGLFRSLGHGKIEVTIGTLKAKIIGTICMDTAFIDITETDAKTGSEVVIFQNINDINNISKAANTIPYEVLSAISHRVKRSFFIV